MPYEMPGELEEAIGTFIDYYNYQRYHEGLCDVTLYDVYTGRHLEIIQKSDLDLPPKKESSYNVSKVGQKGGIDDQKRLHTRANHKQAKGS